ncbi:MAG: SRPBCC family protein [Phycisphaerales bacterium]
MPALSVEKIINAPREVVFGQAGDVHNWASRIEAIERIEVHTEGAVGNGTRFTETRTIFGKQASETMTFADFDPPNGFTPLASSHGSEYTTRHSFEPVGGGTRVSLHFSARPVSLGAKLMTPLFVMMKGSLRTMLLKDLDDLAAACERGGVV